MSRGKIAGVLGIALLTLGALAVTGVPAQAALTVSSGSAGGLDDHEPGPVSGVTRVVDRVARTVTLSWQISADDFSRQAPVGGDFTSGGTFVNVNDVTQYSIYRGRIGEPLQFLTSVGSSVLTYTDASVELGVTYRYGIAAADASGNESSILESLSANLGPPPKSTRKTPPGIAVRRLVRLTFDATVDVTNQEAVDQFKADLRALLASILGVDPSRIVIGDVRDGSVIVDFEITEDSSDSADSVSQRLADAVENDPDSFSSVGPVLGLASDSAGDLDFGDVEIDGLVTEVYEFTNESTDSTAVLTIAASVEGNGFIIIDEDGEEGDAATLTLDPDDTGSFEVGFSAAEVQSLTGDYVGTLTILTNDTNNGESIVNLTAAIPDGLSPATIDLSSQTLSFANVTTGLSRRITLTIRNLGDLDLDADLAVSGNSAFSIRSFGAKIDGLQATGSVGEASGYGTFLLNQAATQLTFAISIDGLTGFTAAHIHGPAAAGESAGVIRGFEASEITEADGEITIEGVWTDMTAAQVADLRAGLYYVNFHTEANPGGEIRGQILTNFVIAGGASQAVAVRFSPTVVGPATGTITVTTNDPATPEVTVSLSGNGTSPSDILVLVDADGNQVLGDFVTTGDSAGKVDFDDFFAFADQFNTTAEDEAWIESFDISQDGSSFEKIDFDDFFVFADNFNKTGTYQSLGQ